MLFILCFQILAELISKNNLLDNDDWLKMTTAWFKSFFYECVICVCLAFATIFLFIAFFMALGFLMGVLTISFTLPISLYKSLWISKNG